MGRCCVPRCSQPGTHKFPKEEKRRQLWLDWLDGLSWEKTPTQSTRLCHNHFLESDYENVSKYTGFPNQNRYLKKTAVPSVFEWNKKCGSEEIKERKERSTSSENPGDEPFLKSPIEERQVSWEKLADNLAGRAPARTYVKCRSKAQLVPDICKPASQSQEYSCNVCKESITGFRYACVQCRDWDLCGACEARGEHATHFVLRIPPHKTRRETLQMLAVLRRLLEGFTCASHTASTALVPQEIQLEDPLPVEVLLNVPGENVKDTREILEECLDTDSTDGTDYILPTAQPKRKIPRNKRPDDVKTVSSKKRKGVTDETKNKSAVQQTSSHTVPTEPAKNIIEPNIAIRQVSLKELKLKTDSHIKNPALTPAEVQKGSSHILPIALPNWKMPPNTVIRKISLKKLKLIQDRIKKCSALKSNAVQGESTQSNTGEGTGDKMECLSEKSFLPNIKKEIVDVTFSDDTISHTIPQTSSSELESFHVQDLGSATSAISGNVIVKLEEMSNESSRDSLEDSETPPSKDKS